jgi:predicted negative regulator of RcsB-dependent stress response
MNHMKPEKHIRDLLKEKDAFLTTTEKVYEFALRHTRTLVIGAAAVVLAVIIGFAYVRSQRAAEEAAGAAYEEALAAASPVEALEKLRADYPGRRAGRLAALALVRLHTEAGVPEKALPLVENLLQTLKPAEIALKPLLLDNLGGLYETVRDYPRAAQSYQALLNWPSLPDNYKSNIMLALGRVQDAAGQPEAARSAYEDLLRSFPDSYPALMARARLSTLTAEALALPLDPPLVRVDAAPAGPAGEDAGDAATRRE